jgi:hypothetical protein
VTFTLQGDVVAPVVSIASPANGSATPDSTPVIAGSAGTVVGDDSTVDVRVFSGHGAGGTPIHTFFDVNAAGGSWRTEVPVPMALGAYSATVTQGDSGGNSATAATDFSVVDGTGPVVSITSPANGSTTSDATPRIAGSAGTADGDAGSVTVRLFQSAGTGGGVLQTRTVGRDAATGTWAIDAAALADGTYTARAEQGDASGNVGSSAPVTFTVDAAPADDGDEDAPSFLLAPAQDRTGDALAGRLTAVAGCASACRINARLTASARAARSLGLGRRSTVLGRGSKVLPGAGTATAAVRLNKRARSALKRKGAASVTLRLKLTEVGRTLTLSRAVSLRRSAGLRRIASGGLRLWGVCSAQCVLAGKLTASAREARRIGLKPRGSRPVQLAAGKSTTAAGKPARLTLKVRRRAQKALRKARSVRTTLEAVAGNRPDARRIVSRPLTLRR